MTLGRKGQAKEGGRRHALERGHCHMLIQDVGWGRTILANHSQASQGREERGVKQPQSTGDSALRFQTIKKVRGTSQRAPRAEALDPGPSDSISEQVSWFRRLRTSALGCPVVWGHCLGRGLMSPGHGRGL